MRFGGDKGSRTPDLLNAIQALYQLSYAPGKKLTLVLQALIWFGGDKGIRTPGLCVANASLYQLSHIPIG